VKNGDDREEQEEMTSSVIDKQTQEVRCNAIISSAA
jgi:hypothetical protein